MDARSALFDLYGDHLRARESRAPVAALVRLLAPLGVAAPAVRTAVSRMVRQGWLVPERVAGAPGYGLTPRAARRLDEAGARIFRTRAAEWDGHWHLLVVTAPPSRSGRDRLRAGLSFLGYAPLDDSTWVTPRPAVEVDALLSQESARAERFTAVHEGDSAALIARAWDLDGLARAYLRFLDESADVRTSQVPDDEAAFVERSRLVHRWRKFLFTDPGLPVALLPLDWPGTKAAERFDGLAAELEPGARRFVDRCLAEAAHPHSPEPTAPDLPAAEENP